MYLKYTLHFSDDHLTLDYLISQAHFICMLPEHRSITKVFGVFEPIVQ